MATEKCVKCGKEYHDEYIPMNLFNGENMCSDCITEELKKYKYWFRSHIPGCCEGVARKYFGTNDTNEFWKILWSRCSKGYVLATDRDDHRYLMEVGENDFWVAGFVNIDLKEEFNLPYYQDIESYKD